MASSNDGEAKRILTVAMKVLNINMREKSNGTRERRAIPSRPIRAEDNDDKINKDGRLHDGITLKIFGC